MRRLEKKRRFLRDIRYDKRLDDKRRKRFKTKKKRLFGLRKDRFSGRGLTNPKNLLERLELLVL